MGTRLGTVSLVGAGPGDPELITWRGRRRLAAADLVLFDALIHPDLIEESPKHAERISVGTNSGCSGRPPDITGRLIEGARAGLNVVRLMAGDPFLFDRGFEEVEALQDASIPFELIPGVTSPLAATAYAGLLLTTGERSSSVAFISATQSPEKDRSFTEWQRLATATETLVVLMNTSDLAPLMQLLQHHGRPGDTPAAVVQCASTPRQHTATGTVATLADLAENSRIQLPALVIVGHPACVRERFRWYDVQPLFGKRVLVTRPSHQSAELSRALREAGAEPIECPLIAICDPVNSGPLERAVQELGTYAWAVFTSANGVHRLFGELSRVHKDARQFGNACIAAIGPKTAAALQEYSIQADVVPEEYRGEAVAAAILAQGPIAGQRVLLARAAVAREILPQTLRAAGAQVDVVAAYRTESLSTQHMYRLRNYLEEGTIDIATFTSSSTVSSMIHALGADVVSLLEPSCVAAIGPITAETARNSGIRVDVVASDYTVEGLVDALRDHYTSA